MPDVTITGLPNASALNGTERVPMDQAGTTVDAAASAIAALATAATVGLGSVNNTSDLAKPVSTATQTALDGKANSGLATSSGLTFAATHRVYARNTAGAGAGEEATLSQLLDWASSTRGSILFRGVSGWVELGPGTVGHYLRTAGAGADPAWQAISGGGDALVANPLSQFADTTSAQFLGVISDKTGTGLVVFNNGPTLIAPVLGTPASGTLTNCTGLPFAAGVSGKPTTLTGYGITDAQPLDSDLTAIAALTTTSHGRSLLTGADAAATRGQIGLSVAVLSDVTGITGATRITNMVSLTQAQYNAITPSSTTFYVII
jgi:hypothetical protein